ncbi:hypothetical protein L6164_024228 [Bauhinia variegata]|uniref:Uncharacterized protein n=1 Tax=Bauhinia variegata TaxID=167791 RepID=A0ACB9LWN1_BAUVA|nr:hypothetical protein L6164_024228 [Bauhinia variegata]
MAQEKIANGVGRKRPYLLLLKLVSSFSRRSQSSAYPSACISIQVCPIPSSILMYKGIYAIVDWSAVTAVQLRKSGCPKFYVLLLR